MQWFFEAGFTVRGGVNQGKTTSRDFRFTVAGAAQVGTAGVPATLPASRLTARSRNHARAPENYREV
jgi:hypothetical protein